MKRNFLISTVLLLFMLSQPGFSVVHKSSEQTVHITAVKKKTARKNFRAELKSTKKTLKAQKEQLFKQSKFRLGLGIFALGIGSSLIGWLLGVGPLSFLGVGCLVVGLLFLVWGLLEHAA